MNTIRQLHQFCIAKSACDPAIVWLRSLPPDTPIREALYQLEPLHFDWLLGDKDLYRWAKAYADNVVQVIYIEQVITPLDETNAIELEAQFNRNMRPIVADWLKEHEERILNALNGAESV